MTHAEAVRVSSPDEQLIALADGAALVGVTLDAGAVDVKVVPKASGVGPGQRGAEGYDGVGVHDVGNGWMPGDILTG